ncbi:ribulose-phosphate 3-epimerase [Sporobacter termitidis]|uniref:ribulose-phosphate 3-epimerase n=1 Tax=Sporobacter termitidis TaxID=44749 RepID=UPI000934ECF9
MILLIKIAPSILSADFTRLGEEIASIRDAEYLHFDVMDGIFVPNISVGIPVLEAVRKFTDMTLDVHLMITEPVRYVKNFIDAGADIVVIHVEADTPERTAEALKVIRASGKRAGLSLKPKTPVDAVLPYLDLLDLILVMTVEPGFGGQKFMADQLDKVRYLRARIDERGLGCEIEVDGGINPETAKLCVDAGVDVLVAGSAVFGAGDRTGVIRRLRCLS